MPATKATTATPTVRTRRRPVSKNGPVSVRKVGEPIEAAVEIKKVRVTPEHTADLTEPGKETTRDFGKLLAKDPNELHQEFVDWFMSHLPEGTEFELDLKTVQVAIATWQQFQRSPDHKAKTIAKREATAAKQAAALVEQAKARAERLAKLQAQVQADQKALAAAAKK